MQKLISVGVAIVMLAIAPSVRAQQQPSAHSVELVQRYFKAMNMEQTIAPLLNTMMTAIIENELNTNPNLGKLQKEALIEAAKEMMNEGLVTRMMANMTNGFAEVLTEKELEAMVAYSESSEGRSVIAKMGQLQEVGRRVGEAMAPEFAEEMARRACSKIECPKS